MKIIKDLNNFYAATLAIGVMTIASIAIVVIDNGSTQNNLGLGNNSDTSSRMFISDIVYLEDLDTKATTSSSTPLTSTTSPSSLPYTTQADSQQSLNTIESDNLQSKDVTEKENVVETLKENVKETAKDSKVPTNTIEIASTNETVDTKVNTNTSPNTDKKIAQAEQAKVQKTSKDSNSLNASNEKSLKTNNSDQSKHTKQVTTAATTTSSSLATQTISANTSVNITSTTSTDAKISSSDSDLVKANSETNGDNFNESSTNLSSNDIYDISFNLLVSKAKTLLVYPKRAQKMGLEGKVSLNIFINKHGFVKSYSINKSSGVRILDEAAEDIGKKLIGFDTKIKSAEYTVVIPIVYRINY